MLRKQVIKAASSAPIPTSSASANHTSGVRWGGVTKRDNASTPHTSAVSNEMMGWKTIFKVSGLSRTALILDSFVRRDSALLSSMASATTRSVMSTALPRHPTIRPVLVNRGVALLRNHRYSPFL